MEFRYMGGRVGFENRAYTYALERQDYATQQVDFLTPGSFDMEEQQEVEIDLSKTESKAGRSLRGEFAGLHGRAVVHVRGQYVPGVKDQAVPHRKRRDEVPDPFAGRGNMFSTGTVIPLIREKMA